MLSYSTMAAEIDQEEQTQPPSSYHTGFLSFLNPNNPGHPYNSQPVQPSPQLALKTPDLGFAIC